MKNHNVKYNERLERPSSMDRFVRKDDPLEEIRAELRYLMRYHFAEKSSISFVKTEQFQPHFGDNLQSRKCVGTPEVKRDGLRLTPKVI